MQRIVFEEPYEFIPPYRGNWWPSFIQLFELYKIYLRKDQGIVDFECRHVERLKASLAAGHGIMLAPNHARPGDPIVMGVLAKAAGTHVFGMASWHLFKQDWFSGFAIRRMGGFSLYREGMDRQSINTAIEILERAERPLIVFPEGSVTRTNDRLHALLDGVSFIARTAAKRREKLVAGGKVVVHPVAIKYLFGGDLEKTVTPVLDDIELRLSWQPHDEAPLLDRIYKIGHALLALKEIEYFGAAQHGSLTSRLAGLIDRLLGPLEEEWLSGRKDGPVVPRVKNLRMAILPDMVKGNVNAAERRRRWRQLADIYLAQQVSCYFPDYLTERPTETRILETVERFEEDLTDKARVHGHLKAVIEVGEPIEVSSQRDRNAEVDPLMVRIGRDIQTMLYRLSQESPVYEAGAG
ncbi:MAG: 1-acyl-sn-glycerol-3-phosphate acyltransferase [Planctomycetales bacterium]|nr:1-acyl-sn-glycerol-3-phosphate acyltransferase [Planctomycetales bacterium]